MAEKFQSKSGFILASIGAAVGVVPRRENIVEEETAYFGIGKRGRGKAKRNGGDRCGDYPTPGCIIAAWVLMFLCLKGGAKSLSKAAKFTVAIPITLLMFLAGTKPNRKLRPYV